MHQVRAVVGSELLLTFDLVAHELRRLGPVDLFLLPAIGGEAVKVQEHLLLLVEAVEAAHEEGGEAKH